MACRSCSAGLGRLPRRITTPLRKNILDSAPLPPSLRCASSTTTTAASALPFATLPATAPSRTARRALHTTSSRQKFSLKETLLGRVRESLSTGKSSYYIYKATENMYKACAAQADYAIEAADRKAGKLQTTADGEEIGASKGGPWHEGTPLLSLPYYTLDLELTESPPADLALLPTFSTWAHVTMLHMYLLVVRFRCLDAAAQQAWQAQLVNHFFYHAEAKMEDVHELHARMVRQTYLKDLFVQWRGLMLAYDEGIVKGDAVLASAVWRNLFKAREDVDVRALAAVVAWMRAGLRELGEMADEDVEISAVKAFPQLTGKFSAVDVPAASIRPAFERAGIRPS
jgi:cytochrome b pre-mRNA-processing protein 3